MKYRIYFTNMPSSRSEVVEASNYTTNADFVTFYRMSSVGDCIYVSSYKTSSVSKIQMITEEETIQQNREKKLERIMSEDSFFKRLLKKIIGK